MPHYYFHVCDGGGVSADEEGLDVADLAAARTHAIDGIRSILSDEIRTGEVSIGGRVLIMDESNRILLTVPFTDAVKVDDTPYEC